MLRLAQAALLLLSTCLVQPVKSFQQDSNENLNSTNSTLSIHKSKFEVPPDSNEFIEIRNTSSSVENSSVTDKLGSLSGSSQTNFQSDKDAHDKRNSSASVSPLNVSIETTTQTSSTVTVLDDDASGVVDSSDTTSPSDEEDNTEADVVSDEDEPNFDPPRNVSQYMDYIEKLFHDLRLQIKGLFEPHVPKLVRSSQKVQLTNSCSYDFLRMAIALRQFEPWALRMIDSAGKLPDGIFEGSFAALGSYDQCLNIEFATRNGATINNNDQAPDSPMGNDENTQDKSDNTDQQGQLTAPTRGQYCLVMVSPYLPPKPPADRIERLFQEEANRRNYTKDDQFSRLSPIFYYMKFRIGVCIPSTCVESDMQSISEALSSSLKLNVTIPHCRARQTQPITSKQLVAGLIFGSVVTLVSIATLMDFTSGTLRGKAAISKKVQPPEEDLEETEPRQYSKTHKQVGSTIISGFDPLESIQQGLRVKSANHESNRSRRGCRSFNERLQRHWSWMSFSCLTNFRLFFGQDRSQKTLAGHKPKAHINHSNSTSCSARTISLPSPNVDCLNGIRVLSLCWVIIANSYITLDPRATKRLAKSREAPRDFLFQVIVQASLAIETFFFLSGLLMSLSYSRKILPHSGPHMKSKSGRVQDCKPEARANKTLAERLLPWVRFYVHRYIRMTPATMLVIAFMMFTYRFGDGPIWFEATSKAHKSCGENWWRHLLHVANFIDTRQMCFIHYWYIAADMQLFLFAPPLMYLLYRWRRMGYLLIGLIASASVAFVFSATYTRNLPPTLLFYNSDPESRREFGNSIMTKPLTHVLPYMVGIIVGKWITEGGQLNPKGDGSSRNRNGSFNLSLYCLAAVVGLAEVFLPYQWNNAHLPSRLTAALYAAFFRFTWSLVLAYVVIACRHEFSSRCKRGLEAHQSDDDELANGDLTKPELTIVRCTGCCQRMRRTLNSSTCDLASSGGNSSCSEVSEPLSMGQANSCLSLTPSTERGLEANRQALYSQRQWCLCGQGGGLVNRLLSLSIFAHLSKLSFVAYLIHLPLMSAFIAQTQSSFAFSHSLVIHLALSYLVITFALSFLLVHVVEFPFLTFEKYLFDKLELMFEKGRRRKREEQALS